MSRTRSIALGAVVAIVALLAGALISHVLLQSSDTQPALVSGTLLEPARPLPPLEFIDQARQPFDAGRLQGRWTLMFFGFTSCPDVCPTTLATLAQTEKLLGDLPGAQRPQVVFVSVDPQRDTPEQLASYVQFFDPGFVGITATQERIERFTREMGVVVAITPLEGGGYTVDHSAAIFLVDPNGAMRALFSAPHSAQQLAADYRKVVSHDAAG